MSTHVYKISKKKAEFYRASHYDFASAIFDNDIFSTFTKSGLHDIACIIQKELFERNLLDSVFVEFNVIGTLLDEKAPNILNRLVYIREGEESPGFSSNITKYSEQIVNELEDGTHDNRKFTLFNHPDIFIDQNAPKVHYSIIEHHKHSRAILNEEPKPATPSPYISLGFVDAMDSDSEKWVGGKAKIVLGNLHSKKNYEEILETAEAIRNRGDDAEFVLNQFHRYYHNYFAGNRKTVFMSIPILGAYAGNRRRADQEIRIQGQGVVLLFFTVPRIFPQNQKKVNSALNDLSEVLFDRIGSLVRLLTYNYLFNLGLNLTSNVKQQAITSAVSAIMSRNLSHNLGSHCIHYTKSAMENLSGRVYGHGPEIRGAARLISYIQGRMDFLATLVSGDEYPYGSVNFKSQIVDVLNVDDFSKRHYQSSSVREKYKIIKQNNLKDSLADLAFKLETVIKEKKERDNSEITKIVDATEELIQKIEGIKLDNADLRTTNFLLDNLIKSERFYRDDIYGRQDVPHGPKDKPMYLYVRYNGELFTGLADRMDLEETVKQRLSELNLALPGGIMSVHAFFNIVENLIRNSAKHRSSDLKENALITTIDVREFYSKGEPRVQFTIYDNKHNAEYVYPIMMSQLKDLRILNEHENTLNKQSKGMKEMLVAALWLRSNEFGVDYSEILDRIEAIGDGDKKIEAINKYAYELVKVDDEGNLSNQNDANLGLRFTLPCFETSTRLKLDESAITNIDQAIISALKERQVRADIVEMIQTECVLHEVEKRFPRLFSGKLDVTKDESAALKDGVLEDIDSRVGDKKSYEDTLKLYTILKTRFGKEISQYVVAFGDSPRDVTDPAKVIYFQRHLNKSQDFATAGKFLYADSVSGGNFTVTLQDHFLRGHAEDGKCLAWKDKYFELKLIESALTRVTLIDERLSHDYDEQELKMKNIRVLNLNPEAADEEQIWSGSSFKDNDDYTLFLSIHLGLIEKIIANDDNWFMRQYHKTYSEDDADRPEKATFFMDTLRKKFGKDKEIFISVHSGRGNYSYELEHSLKNYPFINLSALESVFTNSKYLLTQLFYNTIYIGKGIYNQSK